MFHKDILLVHFFYTLEKEIRRWTTKLGAQVYVRPLKVLIYIRNYDVIMVPSSHSQEPNVLFISTKLPSIHFLPLILGFFQVTGVYKCTWHQENPRLRVDFLITGNARQRLPFPRSSTPTFSRALTAVRERLGTPSPNKPCSAPPLLKLLHWAAATRCSVPFTVLTPKLNGWLRWWMEPLGRKRSPIGLG